MADDESIAMAIAGVTGLLTLANVGWTLFRSFGADGRDTLKSLDVRVRKIEDDELQERVHDLPTRLGALETKCHSIDVALTGVRAELKSSDDKLDEVLQGISSIEEKLS
jgi:hypothetical protein